MKRVFVDTNILVDLIADRKPFSNFAIIIFSLAERDKLELFTSSHSIATTHYLLKKYIDEIQLREVLINLSELIQIEGIHQETINTALRSNHKDFEDALQITCASAIDKLDCIVTRNIKDFKNSRIPVFEPDELIKLL
jgi:predicted nucleic acid-binding protein